MKISKRLQEFYMRSTQELWKTINRSNHGNPLWPPHGPMSFYGLLRRSWFPYRCAWDHGGSWASKARASRKTTFFLATWLFRSLGCWFWVGGLVGVVVGRYLEQMDSVAWSNIHQAKDALLAHSKEIWYSHILSGPVSLRVSQKIIPSPAPQS